MAMTNSGIRNLKKHYDNCAKFKRITEMILDHSGRLSTYVPKFEAYVLRELLSYVIIIYDLPFQFVEYKGIRRVWNYF